MNDDETKLYDRSIRLWGVEAQNRIRATSILVVGLGALTAEVCKNVALAGVKRIGLLDDAELTELDLGSLFLASSDHIRRTVRGGTRRFHFKASMTGPLHQRSSACEAFVRELNPYVHVACESVNLSAAVDDAFWKHYDIVCVSKQTWALTETIAAACHRLGVKFYCGDCIGYYGFMFADLGSFHFSKTVEQATEDADGERVTVRTMEHVQCASLSDALACSLPRPKRVPPVYWTLQALRQHERVHGTGASVLSADDLIGAAVAAGVLPDADLLPRELMSNVLAGVGAEVACVAAVLGGILGQELIRAAAADDTPIQGFLVYDAFACTAVQIARE